MIEEKLMPGDLVVPSDEADGEVLLFNVKARKYDAVRATHWKTMLKMGIIVTVVYTSTDNSIDEVFVLSSEGALGWCRCKYVEKIE